MQTVTVIAMQCDTAATSRARVVEQGEIKSQDCNILSHCFHSNLSSLQCKVFHAPNVLLLTASCCYRVFNGINFTHQK